MCIILRILGITLLNITEKKIRLLNNFVSLNMRNGKGILEETWKDPEGSVVFKQLEKGFKGILESLKCKQYILGIYHGRQIRLELVG